MAIYVRAVFRILNAFDLHVSKYWVLNLYFFNYLPEVPLMLNTNTPDC